MTRPFDSPEAVALSTGAMRDRRFTFSPRYDGFMYDRNRVTKVRNGWGGMTKPYGGFWLSVNGAWERWCESEEPSWIAHGTYEVEISPDARIYVISSMADLDPLPKREPLQSEKDAFWRFGLSWMGIPVDFEAMSGFYDGILLELGDDRELYRAMYGWDCDSLLLFSADAILGFREVG